MSELPTTVEVEKILKSCMDSPGYVVFAAYLTGRKGAEVIQFRYRRYQFCSEDLQKFIDSFKIHAGGDMAKLLKDESTDKFGNPNSPTG